MAYVIEQAYRTIFEREERQRKLDMIGTMDRTSWEELLSMAGDAMWAERQYRESVNGECFFGAMVVSERFERYKNAELLGRMVASACRIVHIDQGALYNAARILDRYYERGGTKVVDAEMLIRSQM